MKKWYSVPELAERFSVVPATVAGWIEDGELEAVDVARSKSVRKRWRVSEDAVREFEQRRGNDLRKVSSALPQRSIARPTKDYLAAVGTKATKPEVAR